MFAQLFFDGADNTLPQSWIFIKNDLKEFEIVVRAESPFLSRVVIRFVFCCAIARHNAPHPSKMRSAFREDFLRAKRGQTEF